MINLLIRAVVQSNLIDHICDSLVNYRSRIAFAISCLGMRLAMICYNLNLGILIERCSLLGCGVGRLV